MTIALGDRGIRGVVLDIEGTTTPLSFVTDTLFPYARAHLREHLTAPGSAHLLGESLRLLRNEWASDRAANQNPPAWETSVGEVPLGVAPYVEWLMGRDRKSPGLKLLQGMIWQRGYADGTLRGVVFPDVPPALERWHAAGLAIAIYSSGSVLAQQLLFSTTRAGDLTLYIDHFFDTAIGPKMESLSYRRIAEQMHIAPGDLLFISDAPAELAAATTAGLQALLCVRAGKVREDVTANHAITTFASIGP